jgi:hypothetical protein
MASHKICSIAGCDKKTVGRGWCRAHYHRWRRYGDPVGGYYTAGFYLSWLKKHKNYAGRDCLRWPFARQPNGSTGALAFRGRLMSAARIMCYLVHGRPPKNASLATHTCGKGHKACVNPQHLRWASSSQNAIDRLRDGTDFRGEKHPSAKLTRKQVLLIRKLAAEGRLNCTEIGRKFGVVNSHVSAIARRKEWAWLP